MAAGGPAHLAEPGGEAGSGGAGPRGAGPGPLRAAPAPARAPPPGGRRAAAGSWWSSPPRGAVRRANAARAAGCPHRRGVRSGLGAHPAVLVFLARFGDLPLVTVLTAALMLGCAVARRWRGAVLAAIAVPVTSALTEHVLKPGSGRTLRGCRAIPAVTRPARSSWPPSASSCSPGRPGSRPGPAAAHGRRVPVGGGGPVRHGRPAPALFHRHRGRRGRAGRHRPAHRPPSRHGCANSRSVHGPRLAAGLSPGGPRSRGS